MIIELIFLCGSGLSFSRTESLLHEWSGILVFICIVFHLVWNRKWFRALAKGRYSANRTMITVTDILLILLIVLIVVSSLVISGYVFSSLDLGGAAWGRRIHYVCTAWIFLIGGIHFGMHLKTGKRNPILYIAGAAGIAAFVICRFYERLFLLNEFAYMPDIPQWTVYLLHALMFAAFMTLGNEFFRLIKRKTTRNHSCSGPKTGFEPNPKQP